ncbi:hypothetical protein MY4824_004321 [Beauveria thailandica]
MDGPIRTFTASSTFPQSLRQMMKPLPATVLISLSYLCLRQEQVWSTSMDKMPTPNSNPQATLPRSRHNFAFTHTHGWKPETMRPAVLLALALALASVLLAALLEILVPKERRQWRSLPRCPSFGTAPVLARRTVDTSCRSILSTHPNKLAMLDQSILNAGYAATWLNQPSTTTLHSTRVRPLAPFSF